MRIWLIECGTGCSCCNYENHMRGPYKSKEDAERRIKYWESSESTYWPLASQYARRGTYYIEETVAEILSDGRYIVDEMVYPSSLEFITVNKDGTVENNYDEYFVEV